MNFYIYYMSSTLGNWRGPDITKKGLVFYINPNSPNSFYDKSSTIIKDISGNGIICTLTDNPTYNSSNGGSIFLNSFNNISINQLTSYAEGSKHSYSAWIYPTTLSGSYRWILNNGDGDNGTSLVIHNTDKIGFFYHGGQALVSGTSSIIANTWNNIVSTYDGITTVKLYLNGLLDSVKSTTSPSAGSYASWISGNINPNIGSWFNGNYRYEGRISDLLVYNTELTSSEVLQNYNALKNRFGL